MKTIVFIQTTKSGSSRDAIRAAERMGFFTVLLTNRPRFIEQRLEFPDVHQMILTDLSSHEAMKEAIMKVQNQGKRVQQILSFVDPYVHVAASLSEHFGLMKMPFEYMINMEDKVLTRTVLQDHPASPHYDVYQPGEDRGHFEQKQDKHFPLIIKSPMSAGSKDVFLANDRNGLHEAMDHLLAKYAHSPILVEEYMLGPQYLVETVVHGGMVHLVAIIKQEITFKERFIVTGYKLVPKPKKELYESVLEIVTSIIESFGMESGACHLELRLVEGQWKLIEINPRISGGAMNRMIEEGFGINLVEETIKLFMGYKPNLNRKHSKRVYVHYITVDQSGMLVKVTGKKRATRCRGVKEVYIKPRKGKVLRPPLSMGDRYGYVLASAKNHEDVKKLAKKASGEIEFHLDQTASSYPIGDTSHKW
ncbi:ATP-grasp domain-containing protein [Peribacillus sp. SCS-155]|uniref:ATP-grasp domain-containing protein n=1 Tax=Peribacillus sedimenti TaxID=3115297 RepID=UPI003905F407